MQTCRTGLSLHCRAGMTGYANHALMGVCSAKSARGTWREDGGDCFWRSCRCRLPAPIDHLTAILGVPCAIAAAAAAAAAVTSTVAIGAVAAKAAAGLWLHVDDRTGCRGCIRIWGIGIGIPVLL
jgi:hypothetical protein